MLLNNGEIFQAALALAKLSQMDFPVKTSYAILRVMRQIKDQAEIVSEVRQGLFKKYGSTRDDGQIGLEPKDKNWVPFNEDLKELFDTKIDLEVYPVVLTEDGFGKDAVIDAGTLAALEKFITDKPYEPKAVPPDGEKPKEENKDV